MTRALALALFLLLLPCAVAAQTLFEADFTQSTVTGMGFTDSASDTDAGTNAARSVVVNGGPSGAKNAIRWVHRSQTLAEASADGNTQHSCCGVSKIGAYAQPARGVSIFLHLYDRPVVATEVDNWTGGGDLIPDDLRQKTIDIGNGTGSARFIMYSAFGQPSGIGATQRWRRSMCVGTDCTLGGSAVFAERVVSDGWGCTVMELRGASTLGGSNGIFRIAQSDSGWLMENTAVTIDEIDSIGNGWENPNFHSFTDGTLGDEDAIGPALTIEIGGFKIASSRDTSWCANMTAGSSSKPVFRYRIR